MMPELALAPEADVIEAHLSHITSRWAELGEDCLLEVVFLTADDRPQVRDPRRFRPDQIEEAAAHVAAMNQHRLNAYVVVNPVRADAQIEAGKRASGEHIAAAFFHWADADTQEAAENIRNLVSVRCTFSVITGTTPFTRPHVYWELEDPTRNFAAWTQTQRAIAATLKSDPMVVDPPRIMRIGGTINWPKPQKQAKGYVPEITTLRVFGPIERPPVSSERMARAFVAAPGSEAPAGAPGAPLDRERAALQALTGQGWHDAVIRLVASYVRKGLSDGEIHTLTDQLTTAGYTPEDTRREVQEAIEGARRKKWGPEPSPGPWRPDESRQEEPAEPAQDDGGTEDDGRPFAPYPDEDAQAARARDKPRLEWFDEIEPVLSGAYLVKGILDAGAMSVVYGPSNSGKTFFALDLAFHIAIGAPWRGHRVHQAGVLYLAAEGGRGVANRVAALRLTTGVCEVPLALRRAGLDLLKAEADLQAVYDLAKEVQARAPGLPLLIVVDTLSRVMAGGDENSAADMTALIRNLDALRESTGAHMMLVHHSGKDTARGARGHSSLRAATDTEVEVQSEDGQRAAMVTKQRDNPGGESFAFALKSVSLGKDQDGDEVSSCVVEEANSEPADLARRAKSRGRNQLLIMEAFDQMVGEGMARPNPGGVGMPDPGRFWVVDMADLRRVAQGKMASEHASKLFRQAWEALTAEDGLFVVGDNLTWRLDRKIK